MSAKASSPSNPVVQDWLLACLYQVGHKAIEWQMLRHRHPWRWSLRLLQHAADRGHLIASAEFGALLFDQGACRTEKSTGLEYLRLAARGGVAQAQFQLGTCFSLGNFWLEQDLSQGMHWLHLAAEQNHPEAVARLRALSAESNAQPEDDMLSSSDKVEKNAVLTADVA